jgi:hypothetical protein
LSRSADWSKSKSGLTAKSQRTPGFLNFSFETWRTWQLGGLFTSAKYASSAR